MNNVKSSHVECQLELWCIILWKVLRFWALFLFILFGDGVVRHTGVNGYLYRIVRPDWDNDAFPSPITKHIIWYWFRGIENQWEESMPVVQAAENKYLPKSLTKMEREWSFWIYYKVRALGRDRENMCIHERSKKTMKRKRMCEAVFILRIAPIVQDLL